MDTQNVIPFVFYLAHRFRRWLMGEVLPAVRRKQLPAVPVQVPVVQALPPMRGRVFPEALALSAVGEARRTWGIRVAREVWVKMGLPIVPAMQVDPAQLDLFNRRCTRSESRPKTNLNR